MTDPVDFTNLREMTDGDEAIERLLFDEFYLSSEKSLAKMGDNCAEEGGEAYKASAHAMKGVAMNLGAKNLSELCATAEESYAMPSDVKESILAKMNAEYLVVKAFLKTIY